LATKKVKAQDPEQARDIAPVEDEVRDQVAGELTVNGQPIPEHLQHLIPWAQTDQGRAKNNEGKVAPIVTMVRDEWANKMEGRANLEPWESSRPFEEAVDRVREPGYTYRMLSPTVIDKKGMRGWEPAETRKGERPTVSRMIIGRMPIERAEKRNQHYRDEANEELAATAARYATDQEKSIRDSGREGVSVLHTGDELHAYDSPERQVPIGVHSKRGA
jgi:hypothetical protein